jgi:hypothetical protein
LSAIASGFSFSNLVTWSLALGALFALAAIPDIAQRYRTLNEGWVDWTRNLALVGFVATAVTEFTLFARWAALANAYVQGDASTRAAIAAEPLLLLDPQGWLTFGAVGVFIFTVSWLSLRNNALPKVLGFTGLAAGLMFWLTVAGFITQNEILITLAAGLGGVVLAPLFFIWMGLLHLRTETAGAARTASTAG